MVYLRHDETVEVYVVPFGEFTLAEARTIASDGWNPPPNSELWFESLAERSH